MYFFSCTQEDSIRNMSFENEDTSSFNSQNDSCNFIGLYYNNSSIVDLSKIGQEHNILLKEIRTSNPEMRFSNSYRFYDFLNKEMKYAINKCNVEFLTQNDSLSYDQITSASIWEYMNSNDLNQAISLLIENKTMYQIDFLYENGLISQNIANLLKIFIIEIFTTSNINLTTYYQALTSYDPNSFDYIIAGGTFSIFEYSYCYWEQEVNDGKYTQHNRILPLAALATADAVGFVGGCFAWGIEETYKGTYSTSVGDCARNGLWGAITTSDLGGWL